MKQPDYERGDSTVIRGILQQDEQTKQYSVLYSRDGYAANVDSHYLMELRVTGTREWVPAYAVDFPAWLGKSVELRHMPAFLMVYHLVHTHQDDSDLIYEVYREEDNVVLHDGDVCLWKPENLVFRGGKHRVAYEYGEETVYRWDIVDGVMRLCIGKKV